MRVHKLFREMARLLKLGVFVAIVEAMVPSPSHRPRFVTSRLAPSFICSADAESKASSANDLRSALLQDDGWEEELPEPATPLPPPKLEAPLWPALILLTIFTLNQWSRSIIFYTVNFAQPATTESARLFMNLDVGFDEAQYGILASIGFSVLFAATSLVAGGVVDRVEPRGLLSGTVVLWSLANVWQAQARSFGDVLGSRMLSGFAQAFNNPASYTILSRQYPPERRATVNGLYSSGLYFGGEALPHLTLPHLTLPPLTLPHLIVVSLYLCRISSHPSAGGLAALSILLDDQLGWRNLSLLVGLIGIVLALVGQLTLPLSPLQPSQEIGGSAPASEAASEAGSESGTEAGSDALLLAPEGEEATSGGKGRAVTADDGGEAGGEVGEALRSLGTLLAIPTVQWLLVATGFRFMAGFAVGVWIVPFYRGSFPDGIGPQFAVLKAGVNGIAGSLSAAGGGLLTDRLTPRDVRFSQWVPAAGSLLAIPFWVGTIEAPTLQLSLAFLFVEYLLAECWFGPTVAALQTAAPAKTQGLAQGLFSTLTLVGNTAPALIGFGVSSLGYELPQLLLISVPVLYAASAVAFVVAGEKVVEAAASQQTALSDAAAGD